ncbi:MAG: hypothetical protein ACM30G_08695 [Micromonosporaceae bacterium]
MTTPPGHGLLIIERILRDRDGIWRQVVEERGLRELTVQMLASSTLSLACYGVVLGSSHSLPQAVSSGVKLPLLFLATLAICMPTLYLFNLVFGARLSVIQAVTLIMVSITVTSVLALAFAPISLFFLITAHSYAFFKLLNVCILLLSALVGLRFLVSGMRALNDHQMVAGLVVPVAPPEPAAQPALVAAAVGGNGSAGAPTAAPVSPAPASASIAGAAPVSAVPVAAAPGSAAAPRAIPQPSASMALLYIWILLFGFVGTQLAWTLRPFFGSPGHPFALFRPIKGTFYADILITIGHLLGG